jgi:hypothetical protein
MQNLADIVGANATVALVTPNVQARWVIVYVSGAGTVRLGGSTVSSALGLPVVAGASMFFPYAGPTFSYSIGGIYAYIPAGATVSVAYEPFD